eukprot:CAMPEP_0174257384 /NCGR_PEP_ID=MMETSP0439-20130205/6527_1 /TAXON_ID=0 /ORGANISM="Stereomyxa ramosa, Strain Chinc5" /LENGTH=188 /DNA_ID=CAMNT_0015340449 /DNA_START=43 /DNA_END=610 /DNA_ORIENTATION=+
MDKRKRDGEYDVDSDYKSRKREEGGDDRADRRRSDRDSRSNSGKGDFEDILLIVEIATSNSLLVQANKNSTPQRASKISQQDAKSAGRDKKINVEAAGVAVEVAAATTVVKMDTWLEIVQTKVVAVVVAETLVEDIEMTEEGEMEAGGAADTETTEMAEDTEMTEMEAAGIGEEIGNGCVSESQVTRQ